MATFPIRDDEYSVEEISYEEMMSVLATQKRKVHVPERSTTRLHQLTVSEADVNPSPNPSPNPVSMSRRIKENANRELPGWLLNN